MDSSDEMIFTNNETMDIKLAINKETTNVEMTSNRVNILNHRDLKYIKEPSLKIHPNSTQISATSSSSINSSIISRSNISSSNIINNNSGSSRMTTTMKKNTIKNSIQTLKTLNLPGRKDLEIHSNNGLLDKFMSKKIIKNITSPSSKILDRRKLNTVKKKNNFTKISPLIIMMKRSHNKIKSNQKINNTETKKGNQSTKMWKENSINKILPRLQSSQKSKTLEIKTLKVSLQSELHLRRQKTTKWIIYTTYTINQK